MKRVLLDVDGVLADFIGGVLELVREVTGVTRTHADVDRFDFVEALGLTVPEAVAVKQAIASRPNWCRDLAPFAGAVEGVARLRDAADLWIVTSPWNGRPTWTYEREAWLRERFGIPHSRVVHTGAKHLIAGDLLVDDKTATLHAWACHHAGTPIQWVTPHNRNDEWSGVRAGSWDELLTLVHQLP